MRQRWRIKDIAQLYYSSPGGCFSNADRMRFYMAYSGHKKLTGADKGFLGRVLRRAEKMARHDAKHGRVVPFRDQSVG